MTEQPTPKRAAPGGATLSVNLDTDDSTPAKHKKEQHQGDKKKKKKKKKH